MSVAQRVACEDVVMFVNAAITSTGQREHHTSATEQRLSLAFLHEYVRVNYRELYAATLALDINHFNAALVVLNLLRTSAEVDPARRTHEGRLIAARLRLLPPQRVYALLREIRRYGLNNRRTRAIVRDWVAARPDPAFDAVKYRRSLAVAARHAHLALPGEVGTVLFGWRTAHRYQTPVLESWRRAHYDARALYELPYTVAQGLAAQRGIDRSTFLAGIAPRLTSGERLRVQAEVGRLSPRAGRPAPDITVDLAGVPLTRLATYVLSLPRPERARRSPELTAALRSAARRAAGAQAGTWGRVTAVLDDSYSASGSATKRRRPLAVALAVHHLLEVLAARYRGLWLTHRGAALLVHPAGPTGLGERILDGLADHPDRLIVVSDGWDNAPPGLAAEVLRVWRDRLDPAGRTSVVHLNPVYDSGSFDVRRLAAGVASIGIRDAEDAPALVEFARFGTGEATFDHLCTHLAGRVARFVDGAASRPAPAGPQEDP